MVACGKFYKVDSLAVATRISLKYQVLLDDGNRIIIPQGNFKFISKLHQVHPKCDGVIKWRVYSQQRQVSSF